METCAVLPQLIAESSRAMPEWRPLSVLTMEVVKRHDGVWAMRSGPASYCPQNYYLMVEKMAPDYKTLDVICPDVEGGKLPPYTTECRPVDREGVPVPWSEVGL